MTPKIFSINIPASTANLGPGFDSIGLALNRYLRLEVEVTGDEAIFIPKTESLAGIATGADNLIYQVAESVANQFNLSLPGFRINMSSDIPLSRGLGSSASAIVGGVELANQLLALNLSRKKKARIASIFEGHPDNAAASVYGGLVIGLHDETQTEIIHTNQVDVELVALIPSYQLKTVEARSLLPNVLVYRDAVKVSAISNVLVAAMLTNQWELAGKLMRQDLFHQPYRMKIVPELAKSIEHLAQLDAYGCALSGAGPTILFFVPIGKAESVKKDLSYYFADYQIDILQVDTTGVQVEMKTF